jgi:hypothetical protein
MTFGRPTRLKAPALFRACVTQETADCQPLVSNQILRLRAFLKGR